MSRHAWVPSTLGHAETMCRHCLVTNREAAVIGTLNKCLRACPECDGTGLITDYIGLEMKPVGVECDKCHGSGRRRPIC